MAFCESPTSGFKIFAIDSSEWRTVKISINERGELRTKEYHNNMPFTLAGQSNTVYCDSCFCCMGSRGNVRVYDLNGSGTWTVLPKHLEGFDDPDYKKSFMVESNGEILVVLLQGRLVNVFRLDRKEMIWETVTSLEDQTLLLGDDTSLLTAPWRRGVENKVCSWRIQGAAEAIQTVHVGVKVSAQGKIIFVPKNSKQCLSEGSKKPSRAGEGEPCRYDLESGECSECPVETSFWYNIWYEPCLNSSS